MLLVADIVTKKGDRLGGRRVKAITPVSADKLYKIILRARGARPRQAEKADGAMPQGMARGASSPSRSIRSRSPEPLGRRDPAEAHEGDASQL